MTDYCTKAPERVLWVDTASACKVHDEHYKHHNVTRLEADIQLRENIKSQGGILAWIVAWTFYFFVRKFGEGYYE